MTLLEDPKLANIDSMFDNDHFICCKVSDGFAGITKAFCGEDVVLDGSDQEWVEEVGCEKCNEVAQTDTWYCPLGYDCENEDLEDEDGYLD